LSGGRWSSQRHRARYVAPLALALACASSSERGCVDASRGGFSFHFDVSAAVALPPGVPGKVHGSGEAELKLPAVKLRVSGLDGQLTGGVDPSGEAFTYDTVEPIPSLMLLLLFEPSMPGLSFDPMQAWIETHDGRELLPVSYVGPGKIEVVGDYERGCVEVDPAGVIELPRRNEARSWPLPLGSTCFVLAFQARVLPSHGVVVHLYGLQTSGHPMPIPGMRFLRRATSAQIVDVRPQALP
jgi:hypothetical protein